MEDSGIDSEDKISTNNFVCSQIESNISELQESDWDESSNNLEIAFSGQSTSLRQDSGGGQLTTCRILQRKLELKVERAKRNYNQFQEEHVKKSKSSSLIPINRLQIPGYSENQPLVDYKTESDDDTEEISFFPGKSKNLKKQDLTDTFSIQEMTIESDNSEDSESQNLELLPPASSNKFIDKLLNCFYCSESTS